MNLISRSRPEPGNGLPAHPCFSGAFGSVSNLSDIINDDPTDTNVLSVNLQIVIVIISLMISMTIQIY